MFTDPSAARSWDRFLYYCGLVQHLEICRKSGEKIDAQVFREIARTRPPCVLMPLLKTFTISVGILPENTYLLYSLLFFHDNLKSFTLNAHSGKHVDPATEKNFKHLFQDISSRSRNLSVLHLHVDLKNISEELIVNFLASLPNLQHLHMKKPFTQTIRDGLGKLEKIRVVECSPANSCHNEGKFDPACSHNVGGNFKTLYALNLEGTAHDVIQGLCGDIHSDELSRLRLAVDGPCNIIDVNNIMKHVHTMVSHSDGKSLRTFSLRFKPRLKEDVVPSIPFAQTMWSITKWSGLTKLLIQTLEPFSLNNDQWDRLTSRLPNLRLLVMTSVSVTVPEESPTLEVFRILAQNCHNLERLVFFVNAKGSQNIPVDMPYSTDNVFKKLQYLSVGRSPIEAKDVTRVAAYLSQVLRSTDILEVPEKPVKGEFALCSGHKERYYPDAMSYRSMWQRVKDALPTLIQIQRSRHSAIDGQWPQADGM